MTTRMSFSAWPVFTEDEIEAASRVLRSGKVNYWTVKPPSTNKSWPVMNDAPGELR